MRQCTVRVGTFYIILIILGLSFRFDTSHVVLNHLEGGSWGKEEKHPLVIMMEDGGATRAFAPGKTVQLVIKAGEKSFDIFVNGVKFAALRYRIRSVQQV